MVKPIAGRAAQQRRPTSGMKIFWWQCQGAPALIKKEKKLYHLSAEIVLWLVGRSQYG